MERTIPIYSCDGELLEWVDHRRLTRLVNLGRVAHVIKNRMGRTVRVRLRRLPGEPRPSLLTDYRGTKYLFIQHLKDGHRCYRLRALGECGDDHNLAPPEVKSIFLRVLLECTRDPGIVKLPARVEP